MRLRSLSLDRFGHFTDRAFDFGVVGDRPDFHIIHGPNEAGKTTTMEAALRLFYGFPLRDGYAFKHQRPNLQVSGLLEIDGHPRRFTRLPKRSGSLVDETGTALPEAALAAHLGGLSEEDYRNLLCLDDDTIERGGEEIAQARGDIGRLLFSAAAGVADLSNALEDVRAQADALWRKRAQKTRVADLKRDLSEVEKAIRERDVTASAWRGLKKALAEAREAENTARATRDTMYERAAGIAARHRALPLLTEIDALVLRLAPFEAYPERLDFDPERLVILLAEETGAKADIRRLTTEIEALTATQQSLPHAPKLAGLAEELEALDDVRARDVTAGLDLDRRRDQVREAEAAMARAARDLGLPEECDPRALVLSPAQLARIETARERVRDAESAAQMEAREIAALTERRDKAQTARDELTGKPQTAQRVGDILARHDLDRLLPALAKARQAMEAAEDAERRTLVALSIGTVTFEVLPDCPTSATRALEWATLHRDITQKIGTAEDALAHHLADVAARHAQCEHLTARGRFVPDTEARALLAERDHLWQAHRISLDATSAQAFENSMKTLDAAMLSRLDQASDLGQLRQIEQARAEAQARSVQTETRLTELRDQRTALEALVESAAATIGLPVPLSPQEWHDWVTRQGAAFEARETVRHLHQKHHPDLDRAQRLLETLAPHLTLDAPEFDAAVAAARKLAEVEREVIAAFDKAQDKLEALEKDLAARRINCETLRKEADTARKAWDALLFDCFGDAIIPDTVLASLEPLRVLRAQDERRTEAAQRVATMQTDQASFAEAVAAHAATHNLPLQETPAATYQMLRERSNAAKAAEAQATELADSIESARTALTEAQDRLDAVAREVAAMGQIFPEDAFVDTLDGLRRAALQAQQIISDRNEKTKLERQSLTELGATDLKTARAMLDGVTLAGLEAEAGTVKSDLSTAERNLTEATELRVTAEQALSRVTGDADIAALAERKATLDLELEDAALDHLELSLGHRLAEEAIRRYRDTHRSGMMSATERCFAMLTQGAYSRLTTQPDGSNETLLAVDAGGTSKRVAEMSKGTRFQLYLALRAAAHEQLVAQGTCLPFFCDDIFETFDEDRTSAACRVLEQIGRSGQAIYLTHHRHVVDIAMQVCDSKPIVHEI
ncbi:uncharacterized protein YhaN [Roseovarius sp. MBR-51]